MFLDALAMGRPVLAIVAQSNHNQNLVVIINYNAEFIQYLLSMTFIHYTTMFQTSNSEHEPLYLFVVYIAFSVKSHVSYYVYQR